MRFLPLLAAAGLLAGCGPASETTTEVKEATAYVEPAPTEAAPAPAAPTGERAETAQVVSIEEGSYPGYSLTFRLFSAEQETVTLLANAEELGLGAAGIAALKGRTVAIRWSERLGPMLADLQLDGVSLLGSGAPPPMPGLIRVDGVLSGAGTPSGDLPSRIVVTPASGPPISFDWYVTEAETAADGRPVTAFYRLRPANRLLSISPAS